MREISRKECKGYRKETRKAIILIKFKHALIQYTNMKFIFSLFSFICAIQLSAQSSFTYNPAQPQPGEQIKISYTPATAVDNKSQVPQLVLIEFTNTKSRVIEVPLKKESDNFVGSFTPDTAANLLALGFSTNGKFDSNKDTGYLIHIYSGDKIARGSYANKAKVYVYNTGRIIGVKGSAANAVAAFEQEFKNYPESKEKYIVNYLNAKSKADKKEGIVIVLAEIEATLAKGVTTVDDYTRLQDLYKIIGQRNQSAFYSKLKREKFPDAIFSANDYFDFFENEKDLEKQKALLAEVVRVSEANKNNGIDYASVLDYLRSNIAVKYIALKDWEGFKKEAAAITNKTIQASLYNNMAWRLQKTNTNIPLAEEISKVAAAYAKKEWQKPGEKKPDMYSQKEWETSRKYTYANYAATYAAILYDMNKYKEGIGYAKDAALTIYDGEFINVNTTYAKLAEKVLSEKVYKPQVEKFVKTNKYSTQIQNILKTLYVKKNKSDSGFMEYIEKLRNEADDLLKARLKSKMMNTAAAPFTLNDLDGNKVSLSDFKGKVVILDFWATWCGPCLSSFPAMQTAVDKYPDVKFLFINTWEKEEDKLTAPAKFMKESDYRFHVLLDAEGSVAKDFGVNGIPVKFVIGKDGQIKFSSVGFNGEEEMIKELGMMIKMAGE